MGRHRGEFGFLTAAEGFHTADMFKQAANRTTDAAGIGQRAGIGRWLLLSLGIVAVAVSAAEPVALIRGWTLPFREKDRLTARFSGETEIGRAHV